MMNPFPVPLLSFRPIILARLCNFTRFFKHCSYVDPGFPIHLIFQFTWRFQNKCCIDIYKNIVNPTNALPIVVLFIIPVNLMI